MNTDPTEKNTSDDSKVWDRAVDTLASMCLSEKIGTGPTKQAFIMTLRMYADEMEKLIQPNQT